MNNTLLNRLNKMINELQGYWIKKDNTKKFAKVLEDILQKEFNNNIVVNVIDKFEIEIIISEISIAKIRLDSDGEMMWFNKCL